MSQVRQSRELFYRFCDRTGLRYWQSGANFVLARVGEHAARLTERTSKAAASTSATRSRDYGCDGCIRVTTGVVEHTERCLAAMEEYLCGAR